MTRPWLTATLWGDAGLLLGAALGVGAVAPFYPSSDEGFAQLGWYLLAIAVGALLGLTCGAISLHHGLRRAGDDRAGRTALAFVPAALLLAAPTAGVGALAAPAVARWLVTGFTRPAGWGPRHAVGRPQRLVVAVVASLLLGAFGLEQLGHALGGHVGGPLLVWLAALPAVVLPPVLLLRKVLPWHLVGLATALAAGALALAVPAAVQDVRPEPARLEQIATDLPVPDGQRVVGVRTTRTRPGAWTVPLTVLSTGGPVPKLADLPPATTEGEAAAQAWEQVLRDEGWVPTQAGDEAYWLGDDVRQVLAGREQHEQGPWVRASVLPYGNGAVVVLSLRP